MATHYSPRGAASSRCGRASRMHRLSQIRGMSQVVAAAAVVEATFRGRLSAAAAVAAVVPQYSAALPHAVTGDAWQRQLRSYLRPKVLTFRATDQRPPSVPLPAFDERVPATCREVLPKCAFFVAGGRGGCRARHRRAPRLGGARGRGHPPEVLGLGGTPKGQAQLLADHVFPFR